MNDSGFFQQIVNDVPTNWGALEKETNVLLHLITSKNWQNEIG